MGRLILEIQKTFDVAKQKVKDYKFGIRFLEFGNVVSVGDGIVWIQGLSKAFIDEILIFEDGSRAMVFHLTKKFVGAVLLEQTNQLSSGTRVYRSSKPLSIATGDELLGRVINPLGYPLDGLEKPECKKYGELDILSPPIINRDFVTRPLYTGNKIIDNIIPIGKGQRELIIGDNGLGKSSLALDIVINQKDKNVKCIYVLIGQKSSSIINAIKVLKDNNALNYTVLVVAEATSLPGLKYLAPFSGCAIAESWMKLGEDTLIIYDDLTTHADSYRELSLLMRRSPGREAYPADIFYLHSRLLERATCLNFKNGGGSMTALPIIETKDGEISTYIPTNLISITDGQIFFNKSLFSSGLLPAIDISKSVSRVGGKAQADIIKKESARMKLDYLQFLELEVFTRFGTKVEASVQRKIQKGKILRNIFKQERFTLYSIEFQLSWLIAYNEEFFNNITTEKLNELLITIEEQVSHTDLTLEYTRQEWLKQIKIWLNIHD